MSSAVFQHYARALLNLGEEHSKLQVIHHDLQGIERLIAQSGDFADFLRNPVIPAEKRETILKEIFHGKVDALTYRFLLFLSAKKRLAGLKSICVIFDQLYAHRRGILRAWWTSSVELSPYDIHAITDYLKTKFNSKEVEARHSVDPGILGGIKIQVGDTIFDYTLKTQLEKFKQACLPAGRPL